MKIPLPISPSQLSFWANKHPVTARWLIAFSRIIMGYYTFYWGAVLADIDKDFFNTAFLISALVYVVGFIFYPRKNKTQGRQVRFTRQKLCDGLLVISSCAFWLAAGNYTVHWQPNINTHHTPVEVLQSAITKNGNEVIYPDLEHSKIIKKAKKKRAGFFKKLKDWKAGFFKKLKARVMIKLALIKSAYRQLDGGQIALLILASLAIVSAIGYLTAVISCNLSCNGQEGAATAVAALGCLAAAGLVALMWTSAVKKNRLNTGEPPRRNRQPPGTPGSESLPATPEPTQLEVINPDLKVCLSTDDPKGLSGLTIAFNGEVLMENIQLGETPLCVEVTAQNDFNNAFQVSGASGPVKLSVEDGKMLKQMTLPIGANGSGAVELMLKGN